MSRFSWFKKVSGTIILILISRMPVFSADNFPLPLDFQGCCMVQSVYCGAYPESGKCGPVEYNTTCMLDGVCLWALNPIRNLSELMEFLNSCDQSDPNCDGTLGLMFLNSAISGGRCERVGSEYHCVAPASKIKN